MLLIKELSVHYGVIAALHGISLEVRKGEIVTLIGANGAGKTTTLRAISGLVKSKGEILYEGRALGNRPPHEIVAAGISHVPEGRMIFANLTVAENLEMGAYLQRNKEHIRQDREFVFGMFPRLAERGRQIARHAFRRRTTNAGHRPGLDEPSAVPDAGRALAGHRADFSKDDFREDR